MDLLASHCVSPPATRSNKQCHNTTGTVPGNDDEEERGASTAFPPLPSCILSIPDSLDSVDGLSRRQAQDCCSPLRDWPVRGAGARAVPGTVGIRDECCRMVADHSPGLLLCGQKSEIPFVISTRIPQHSCRHLCAGWDRIPPMSDDQARTREPQGCLKRSHPPTWSGLWFGR
jgi:hypothetical protein